MPRDDPDRAATRLRALVRRFAPVLVALMLVGLAPACEQAGGDNSDAMSGDWDICVGVGPEFVTTLRFLHQFDAAAHAVHLAGNTTATTCKLDADWNCEQHWRCDAAGSALEVEIVNVECGPHPNWLPRTIEGEQFQAVVTGSDRYELTVTVERNGKPLHQQTTSPSGCDLDDGRRFEVDIGPF